MSNGNNHPPAALTDAQIRLAVSGMLEKHKNCGTEKHMFVITKSKIELQHGRFTFDGCAKTIMLTEEQYKLGLTPTEWHTLVRKITKAQLEAER